MHREMSSDSDQLERFRREARAVAQLNHPHIVGVIDAGEDDQTPYIVFEYVEGETLKDRIRRLGRLPVPEAVAYAIEVARALGAAHERQIVHRDVKPQNVLIDEEGTAKVTDFGIARTMTEEGLTADGRVLGTTDYVSPEQALGHEVGPQSDLYSLGIVMFEMLTGDVPFSGENQVAVAMKHVREELPDVQLRRPEVSSSLAAVLDRATAKELERRYDDDTQLIADLEDVLSIETARTGGATGEATSVLRTLPGSARRRLPLRSRVSRGRLIAFIALLAVAVAVILVLALHNTHRGTGPAAALKPPPKLTNVSLHKNAAHDYDPYGTGGEHPELTRFAVDREPSSTWSTENYDAGDLQKQGVGLYIDAKPSVDAKALKLQTPTPGFDVAIYAAKDGPPKTVPDPGWKLVGGAKSLKSRESISLDTASQRFRYYLVWITKLPPKGKKVEISEVALFG
jgi:serine/threonine-protein kinase